MKPTGNSAHARCQKGGVPVEAKLYLQLIHFKKSPAGGRRTGGGDARNQKGGVPEEAKIGRSSTPLNFSRALLAPP